MTLATEASSPSPVTEVNIRVAAIEQSGERELSLTWTDDRHDVFDVVELRRRCPCALCVDENTGKRTLQPEEVGEDVRPVSIRSIGGYAMGIEFSDGHSTGIYTFSYLRQLGHAKRN